MCNGGCEIRRIENAIEVEMQTDCMEEGSVEVHIPFEKNVFLNEFNNLQVLSGLVECDDIIETKHNEP